jgi:hypothetical protein
MPIRPLARRALLLASLAMLGATVPACIIIDKKAGRQGTKQDKHRHEHCHPKPDGTQDCHTHPHTHPHH